MGMNMERLRFTLVDQNYWTKLEAIYNSAPTGHCPGCGTCCYDAVTVSLVEFLAIENHLIVTGQLNEALRESMRAFVTQELTTVQACPFLTEKRCSIYSVRPLTCRLYGFQSHNEQMTRRRVLLKQHKQMAKAYEIAYGYRIPKAVVDHVLFHCPVFIPSERWTKCKSSLLFDRLLALDSDLYIRGLVDEELVNLTLVDWFLESMGERERIIEKRDAHLAMQSKKLDPLVQNP